MLPGWKGHTLLSRQEVQPCLKRGNWDMGDDHTLALCQLYMRRRKYKKLNKYKKEKQYKVKEHLLISTLPHKAKQPSDSRYTEASSSVQFSRSVMSLQLHGLQHTRLPCSSPTPRACSDSCPSRRWCHPMITAFVIPFFSCLQSFPASGSFPMIGSSHQVAKALEFQLQHQSFQWIFRTDFL